MIDHLAFFRKNVVGNLLILAGREQFPARTIVKEYGNRIEAKETVIIWADEEENLVRRVVEKLSASIFSRKVVWVKGMERVKSYRSLLGDVVEKVGNKRGCVISVPDDASQLKHLESGKVILINMRPLTEKEFNLWLKKHLPWIAARPELKDFLEHHFKKMSLSEIYLEIQKLNLYSDKPSREALNLLWEAPSARIFEITEHILRDDVEKALVVVDEMKDSGENPINVVQYLEREVEGLILMKMKYEVPKYQFIRFKNFIDWISEGELKYALERLKKADFDLKGKIRGKSQWVYIKVLVKELTDLLGKRAYEVSYNKTFGVG